MSASAEQLLKTVADTLADVAFRGHIEAEMQRAIANRLHWASIPFEREFRFSAKDRVDFFLPDEGIAIECKVSGGSAEVVRQLNRYALQKNVNGLLLVTTKMQHAAVVPPTLQGKPVRAIVFHRFP